MHIASDIAYKVIGAIFASVSVYYLSAYLVKKRCLLAASTGRSCPICLEDLPPNSIKSPDGLLTCEASCGNVVHEVCFEKWRQHCPRNRATCVCCRAVMAPKLIDGEFSKRSPLQSFRSLSQIAYEYEERDYSWDAESNVSY